MMSSVAVCEDAQPGNDRAAAATGQGGPRLPRKKRCGRHGPVRTFGRAGPHSGQCGPGKTEKKRTRGWGNHGSGSGYRGVGLWGGEQPLKRIVCVRLVAGALAPDTPNIHRRSAGVSNPFCAEFFSRTGSPVLPVFLPLAAPGSRRGRDTVANPAAPAACSGRVLFDRIPLSVGYACHTTERTHHHGRHPRRSLLRPGHVRDRLRPRHALPPAGPRRRRRSRTRRGCPTRSAWCSKRCSAPATTTR